MRMPTTPRQEAEHAAEVLSKGGTVAFPTETVYGLGADARNAEAVGRIFSIKKRPADHPLIVHLADMSQMEEWAQDIPMAARLLAKAFWPGPLTLILKRRSGVLDAVTGGHDTVALRVPSHPLAQALLSLFGDGVAAPSANRYGSVSPTTPEHVREELGDEVDLILDGGPCILGIESTIVDVSSPTPQILRPGSITEHDLRTILGKDKDLASSPLTPVSSPGNKPSHYAPRSRVIIATPEDVLPQAMAWRDHGKRVGILSPFRPPDMPEDVTWLSFSGSLQAQAKVLYQRFHEADHLGLQVLVAVMPQDLGIGHAIRDRMQRAAGLGKNTDVKTRSLESSKTALTEETS